jgi:hypothetical protein
MSQFIHEVKNFLTEQEINSVNNEVFNMKQYWKSLTDYKKYSTLKPFITNKEKTLHVLGDAIYMLHDKGGEESRDEINWNLQEKLKSELNWLYQKLFETIKNEFETEEVDFDYTLPVPGFHIFGGYEVEDVKFSTHQDSGILDYYPEIEENNIRSFVALIQAPTDPPYLDFVLGEDSEKSYYEYGSLYFWHGMIPHRIGPFSLKEGEYRITFQGHFYVDPYTEVVKVYF